MLFFSQHLSNKFKHIFYFLSPQMQCANCISLRMMVTCFACMAHKFVSLNTPTRYASEASCNAKTAILWNCRSVLCSCAILWTKHWKAHWSHNMSTNLYQLFLDSIERCGYFDPPCWWYCCPCSLCSQLLYRSFTTSWLPCCLLCSIHNEGTVVLTMGACTEMIWLWTLLCLKVHTYVSFGASPSSHCGCILCIMYTMMVILFYMIHMYIPLLLYCVLVNKPFRF